MGLVFQQYRSLWNPPPPIHFHAQQFDRGFASFQKSSNNNVSPYPQTSRRTAMSQLPSTPATLPRPPKRAHEEELVGPAKRQRQHGLWTPPEQFGDVGSNTQVPRFYAPRPPSSSPPGHAPYPSPPYAIPSIPPKINPGYAFPPNSFSNNQHYGSGSPLQPPIAPQMGFGNLYQVYGPNVNRHPGPAVQPEYAWGLHVSQDARFHNTSHSMGATADRQPVQGLQPRYTSGIPVPQTARDHHPSHPMVPTMAANDTLHQQQQQCIQRIIGTQGPYRYSATPVAATQCASHQTGVEGFHRGTQVPVVNVQTARTTPRTQQEQWLINAHPDLRGKTVTTVPATPAEQGTLGAVVDPQIELLVPRDVWRLRALPPLQRYIAYHRMVELGHWMSQCDQASEEYLQLWHRIVNVQTSLMEGEVELANKFKQNTAETRATWSELVASQAIETPVNQQMRVACRYRATACVTPAEDLAVKSQPSTSGQVLAQQKPATQPKPLPKPQTPMASAPVVTPSAPEDPIKPDQRTHPQDKVPVPSYPRDKIEYFTPHEVTGMYMCNHSFDTANCCKVGLDRRQNINSIGRTLAKWREQIEGLVKKGDLHESHITWRKNQSPKEKEDQKAKSTEKERLRNEKKADASAKKEARKEQRKKWREEPHDQIDAEGAPGPIVALNPLERNSASASELDSQLSPEEQAAAAEAALQEMIATALKDYERKLKYCKRLEGVKKWPNWPRFNEYWEVKHLEVQGFQLSPEQKIISEGDEPSGIADKNPAFVKKKAEEIGSMPPQDPVDDSSLDELFEDAEENVEQDDTSLDDLFEDDSSE